MNQNIPSLEGVITALGTPLDERENLHEEGMRLQIRMQLEAGVDGLLALGSMGSMQLLKDETFEQALMVACDEVKGQVPVLVGCGDTSTERTLARIRFAENHPISGVALIPPYIFRFSQDELFHYYKGIAEGTDLPVFPYDNPALTGHSLEYETIVQLSEIPNIVGLKASGDFLTFRLSAEHFHDSEEFTVFSGHTTFLDLALQLGASGIIEGLFALAPEYGVEILRSFRKKDYEAAAAAQRKLIRLRSVVFLDSVFAGFTAAMNLRGIPGNFAAAPFTQCTPEGREGARALLQSIGLIE